VDKLFKPTEAAAILGIGRSKIYELMASGRLDSVKIDGCRRIPRRALVAFAESTHQRVA
jgi:excisionase family DNA binding protein